MPNSALRNMTLPSLLIASFIAGCAKPPGPPADRAPYWAQLERFKRTDSNSPYTAYLDRGIPANAAPDTASDAAPPSLRPLLGRWQGWVGRNRSASIAIEIYRIDASTASGRYAHAALENANGALSPNRVFPLECRLANQTYLDCVLSRTFPGALQVYLKPRADGALMFLYSGNQSQNYTMGLLTRDPAGG